MIRKILIVSGLNFGNFLKWTETYSFFKPVDKSFFTLFISIKCEYCIYAPPLVLLCDHHTWFFNSTVS